MNRVRFIREWSDKVSDAEREARQRIDDAYFVRVLRLAWERGEFPAECYPSKAA